MSRRATIIAYIQDAFDDRWDVRKFRDTEHGFQIAFGWPSGFPRGLGGAGGPRTILTQPLVDRLEKTRYELRPISAAQLPIGRDAIKRLRRLLGHNRKSDRRAWWIEHFDEMQSSPTLKEFADRHGVSTTAAELMYEDLVGQKRGRFSAWFREPGIAEKILSGLPVSFIAEDVGRTCDEVCKARYKLGQRSRETLSILDQFVLVQSKLGDPEKE